MEEVDEARTFLPRGGLGERVVEVARDAEARWRGRRDGGAHAGAATRRVEAAAGGDNPVPRWRRDPPRQPVLLLLLPAPPPLLRRAPRCPHLPHSTLSRGIHFPRRAAPSACSREEERDESI